MLGRDLRFFAILHQKLGSLDHCLKLMYHLVFGQTHTWSETQPRVKDAIAAAKKEVIDGIKAKCQLLLDSPNNIGGNTNSAPAAAAFFSPTKHKDICRDISIKDIPIKDISIKDISIKDISIKDISIKDISIKDISIKDISIKDISIKC